MVTAMDSSQRPGRNAKHFSRRSALGLAGAAGLGALASACAAGESVSAQTESTTVIAEPAPQPVSPIEVVQPSRALPVTMLSRESWGALPPTGEGRRHDITRMTIHHTAVTLGDNRSAPARLRQHQAYHQNSHGWIDIAYHVSVDRNGNIYQLRSYDIAGDTATNYDPSGHFLVLCEGNFDEEVITRAQLQGAAKVFAWAVGEFGISPDTLGGHRDAPADTSCPGGDLYGYVTSGQLTDMVKDLIALGGVDLQTVGGAEALDKIAAIEAGRQ